MGSVAPRPNRMPLTRRDRAHVTPPFGLPGTTREGYSVQFGERAHDRVKFIPPFWMYPALGVIATIKGEGGHHAVGEYFAKERTAHNNKDFPQVG